MKTIAMSVLALLMIWTPGVAQQRPPNVLVILADDLGYGDVGCYNAESKIPTPNIDRLATQGMRFTDAHSPSTVCTPSRYSLLTGRMCFRKSFRGVFTGVDGPLIDADRLTIGSYLQQKGYRTACIGKWHIGMTFFDHDGNPVRERGGGLNKVLEVDFSKPIENGPADRGFDYFFGTVCCPTTDFLYAYIENRRLVEMPTDIVRPETSHWLEYAHFREGLKAPGFEFEDVDLEFLKQSKRFLEQHAAEDTDQPFFLYHATQTAHLPAIPNEQFVGASDAGPYGDFVFEFDYVVGELLATLDRLGLDENTIVIVSSDNGPEIIAPRVAEQFGHFSAGEWRGLKRDNWEGGHRVPMIVRWPGTVEAGSTSEALVCLTDIFATIAEMQGDALSDDVAEDSVSFLPVLTGEVEATRSFVIHQTMSEQLAIREARWKWLDHQGSGGNNYDQEVLRAWSLPELDPDAPGQLYDMHADPAETTNVYRQHQDVAERLMKQLAEFRSEREP